MRVKARLESGERVVVGVEGTGAMKRTGVDGAAMIPTMVCKPNKSTKNINSALLDFLHIHAKLFPALIPSEQVSSLIVSSIIHVNFLDTNSDSRPSSPPRTINSQGDLHLSLTSCCSDPWS